mgnify:CR=1 FL=1
MDRKAAKLAPQVRYSDRLRDRICAELASGEPARQVFLQPGMPDQKTHYRWMAAREDYRNAVTAAKAAGIEKLADEIVVIADGAASPLLREDGTPAQGADGALVMVVSNEATNHARLRIDSRKWLLAKMLPKKYGDKVEHEHSGGVTVEVVRFSDGKGQASG